MAILVTGGAGYIGAHVVRVLEGAGVQTAVIDDLSTGDPSRIEGVPLFQLDLADPSNVDAITDILRGGGFDGVIHFAAKKSVPDSVRRPAYYYRQNVSGLANILDAMERASIPRLVFSSSAAVYGDVETSPVEEETPTIPVNPYGETKLAGEWLVAAATRSWGLRATSLRYFNVAGAGAPDLGDPTVANLVTMVLDRLDRHEAPLVFGTDYPTPDGTCVRDFVHVLDLAEAHAAALEYLMREECPLGTFNVGTGGGTSVLAMVEKLVAEFGADATPVLRPRRPGDPAEVVASTERIESVLGWKARLGVDDIVRSAVRAWRLRSPLV